MAAVTPADLASIVLLLGDFTGVDNIIELSENTRYKFTPPPSNNADPNTNWLGDFTEHLKGPILCLAFGQDIFSPQGWVGGSADDTDAADIQLAPDNRTGVSRRHFQVDTHPLSRHPRVTVLSRSLRVTIGGHTILLTHKQSIEITSSAHFDLGGVTFRAWRPKLTPDEQRIYNKRALQFSQEAVCAIPKYFPLLGSAPETITSNVRYGRNNAVYVYQGVYEKGMSASVMLVEERTSGKLFGAKEPYYKMSDDFGVVRSRWEELCKEYENIIKLDHVSLCHIR